MDFIQFARAHGVLIENLPPLGIWKRYPTEDHPTKRNGAVKYMGTYGHVQNHAMDASVSTWKPDSVSEFDQRRAAKIQAQINRAQQQTLRQQQQASEKANTILKQSLQAHHKYLFKKGFPDETGNVYTQDGKHYLVIPMRVDGRLVGCQMIDEDGGKKFLFGQQSANAEFIFTNGGSHYLCEGYATALSLKAALMALKRKFTIHVCFSAGNMVKVASRLGSGIVIADNDVSGTGERVAKQIGWSYWLSDRAGEDFNDFASRLGVFRASQKLLNVIR